ncbi:phytanoyl-CoA dioxygenase family protein [Janthinobacterium agaricidamnosum]|uniref:Phytanoyl-CoA dioxygenase family protein n=1 Tax=Janthinobacterium agaricidamnosum NBRC 102515 = DSM 9628 TaxID=1349767 RepID=W0V166_9BURK|nr:phytanoyl-CoA dioxygenase family protein [Janthinobacterium agaricidamnosum]CDG81012.1 phytanoyl-CoA dioxygenase family protein [Janthinobacterium agaricidamnosum NBRC 102515 = DSM 9628]
MDHTIDSIDKNSIAERNLSTVAKQEFRLNQRTDGGPLRVLSDADWAFWRDNGYLVVKQAVEAEKIARLEQLVWEFEEMDPADQRTWYPAEKARLKRTELSFNAGMIELYNHQYLWDARQTPRVHDAFADVWGTRELWVSIDRMNFNLPPEPGFEFKSFMHWDYDPDTDPQNVQGVLSVSDQTDPEVGGFVCIPELFRNYRAWRLAQPDKWDWYRPDVADLEHVPVALEKGDLLIFNSKLCHGIRQNTSRDKVRMAQYISMMPAQQDNQELRNWRVRSWSERLAPQGYSLHGDPRRWEQTKYQAAQLSPLGERLLGLRGWQD